MLEPKSFRYDAIISTLSVRDLKGYYCGGAIRGDVMIFLNIYARGIL